MRYLFLIYGNETEDLQQSPAQREAQMQAYGAFTAEVQKAGVFRSGEELTDSAKATTVRLQQGKLTTTDGPFAETKEQLGGFYELDCANLDEAIQWAAKIPHAQMGSIEIRPVVEFN